MTMNRARVVALALSALGSLTAGCGDPCARLERLVCEKMDDERRCKLMEDADRREKLGRDACKSILKSLERR
ncbi:MAG: hypothetical protein H6744_07590 [Deltaproteobacteria bacterium]|nr:hypothetical protein [Deltaproteobacteria bacterium]MCB9786542.1 hypothetical protein [Deltaproteobacteria bacterium]